MRLQQILFYKELDFELSKVKLLLEDPDFDLNNALVFQREEILKRKDSLHQLLEPIDKTISEIQGENTMLTDEELYEGFAKEEILEIKQEVNEKFYKTSAEIYKGLGDMYITDARFASFYDQHKPGLAKFLRNAMYYYAKSSLK